MRFTRSKDGVPRATIRVEFRVDCGVLEVAATEIVWRQLVEENPDEVELAAERYADRLTRGRIIAASREWVRSYGYRTDGLAEDDWADAGHAAVEPVVRRLFPEAYS